MYIRDDVNERTDAGVGALDFSSLGNFRYVYAFLEAGSCAHGGHDPR